MISDGARSVNPEFNEIVARALDAYSTVDLGGPEEVEDGRDVWRQVVPRIRVAGSRANPANSDSMGPGISI